MEIMELRASVRFRVARLLYQSGLTAPARRAHGRLSIATFHRVLPEAERRVYPYPNLAVTPQELDALLSFLAAHYDCGTLEAQHGRYLSGEQPSRPLLALTFDDGQHDNFLNARPVLARHKVKATFFIPVAAIERRELLWHDRLGFATLALLKQGIDGRERLKRVLDTRGFAASGQRDVASAVAQHLKRLQLKERLRQVEELVGAAGSVNEPAFARMMTFEEITALVKDGHEIGSHSMTHCLMPECDDQALRYELAESRSVLRKRTGQAIDSFCYPNGDSDARSVDAVAQTGYLRAVTTRKGANGRMANPFQLQRFDMDAARVRDTAGFVLPELIAFRLSESWLRRT
jgi:peptidoglycan/xylan/chitin deacetylase (PgdA/CDA1 family)